MQAARRPACIAVHFEGHDRLRAPPYAFDDLNVTMRILTQLAADEGVPLHLPTVWQREDPWGPIV